MILQLIIICMSGLVILIRQMKLKEQFEDNAQTLQRKIFKEALETVKNTYIVVS